MSYLIRDKEGNLERMCFFDVYTMAGVEFPADSSPAGRIAHELAEAGGDWLPLPKDAQGLIDELGKAGFRIEIKDVSVISGGTLTTVSAYRMLPPFELRQIITKEGAA